MTMGPMNRRAAIKRSTASLASLAGLVAVPAPPSPPVAPRAVQVARNDVSNAVRQWFANRCPLITRLPWVPIARVGFQTFSHRRGPSRDQWCETFHFPVESDHGTRPPFLLPGGIASPFRRNKTMQLQNLVDSAESALYYGVGRAPTRDLPYGKMNGLRAILTTNHRKAPAKFHGYGEQDFLRDTFRAARRHGGNPDLLVVGSNLMSVLTGWGWKIAQREIGTTVFGTPIHAYASSMLPDIQIIEAPFLRPYTAIALTSSEVWVRNKVNPYWRTDSTFGPGWYAELSIEVVNEQHAAWLEAA